ncbi:MAG TPA: MBL fold metallo-hydrolase [Gemmatimonas sp.]|nr:MBL fold metallo-hydrolase [Gemmatimonas sp.]
MSSITTLGADRVSRFKDAFGSYRFFVGSLECLAVSDGALTFPAAWYAANAQPADVEAVLRAHYLPTTQVTNQTTCLLVSTGQQLVLIDTGLKEHLKSAVSSAAPSQLRLLGRLQEHLAQAGVQPGDIDTVVLTHGHPDHVGGLTNADGSLAFPNAHYFMERTDWTTFTAPPGHTSAAVEASGIAVARLTLPAIKDRVTLIDPGQEIAPGVHTLAAAGHTPGHLGLIVSSGNEYLLHVCDVAAHHVLSLEHPEWYFAGDLDPQTSMQSRRRLFDRGAVDGPRVFASHFPFPSLGHVVARARSWHWEPEVYTWQY